MTPKRRRLRCLAPRSRSALRALPQDDLGAAAPQCPLLPGSSPQGSTAFRQCPPAHANDSTHSSTRTARLRLLAAVEERVNFAVDDDVIARFTCSKPLPLSLHPSSLTPAFSAWLSEAVFNATMLGPSTVPRPLPAPLLVLLQAAPFTLPRRQSSPSLPCQPFPRRPRSAPR
jgi:hypothetical protein